MCLSSNVFDRLHNYDRNEYEQFLQKRDEFEDLIATLKARHVAANKHDIRLYLRANRLNIYYEYTSYLEDRIAERTPRPVTYWESVWDMGRNEMIIKALYHIWWKNVPHCNIHYCINPHRFANGLILFAQNGKQGLIDYECKNQKDTRLKEALIVGFVKYPAACLIKRQWKLYVAKKNTCASIIQSRWRECISNPSYVMCRKRLHSEFMALS